VLTGAPHVDQVRRRLPGRPVEAVSTTAMQMTHVALGRARAAVCPPAAEERVTPWDYAGAALAVHCPGGKALAPDGRDLAHSSPDVRTGWLATHRTPTADLTHLLRH
jgi:fructose-1,6-bisphosphatase/inositol monophosphatase family enzyme